MAKVNGGGPPPQSLLQRLDPRQLWPWGGPRYVRERLVDPSRLDRKNAKKKGDPKAPALASAALLDFIGPAHAADEQRLTLPEMPDRAEAELTAFNDQPFLEAVADRAEGDSRKMLERGLESVRAPPERFDRLRVLLAREAQMLTLIQKVTQDKREIAQKRREEQQDSGY